MEEEKVSNESKPWLFKKGNKLGQGNPYAREQARLKKVLFKCLKPKALEAMWTKMLALAADGNVAAARLICDYGYGRPKPYEGPEDSNGQQQIVLNLSGDINGNKTAS